MNVVVHLSGMMIWKDFECLDQFSLDRGRLMEVMGAKMVMEVVLVVEVIVNVFPGGLEVVSDEDGR